MPDTPEQVFTRIFHSNRWKGTVRSGPGSSMQATGLIREQLRALFEELGIRTLCDAPCGDGTWIFSSTEQLQTYIGIDIVKEVVAANRDRNAAPNRFFLSGDITDMVLPSVDAILCRDCLVHLPLEIAQKALASFKRSGSGFLITTTFPTRPVNPQMGVGGWRPLNLQADPFRLPDPIRLLAERKPNPSDPNNDKSLGVWKLADLPDPDSAAG